MFSSLHGRILNFHTTAADLGTLFTKQGRVKNPEVVTDLHGDRSPGCGFVETATPDDASSAISALDGRNLDGRALTVAIAKPRSR
jgi:RNA recognition motif-containing protein